MVIHVGAKVKWNKFDWELESIPGADPTVCHPRALVGCTCAAATRLLLKQMPYRMRYSPPSGCRDPLTTLVPLCYSDLGDSSEAAQVGIADALCSNGCVRTQSPPATGGPRTARFEGQSRKERSFRFADLLFFANKYNQSQPAIKPVTAPAAPAVDSSTPAPTPPKSPHRRAAP